MGVKGVYSLSTVGYVYPAVMTCVIVPPELSALLTGSDDRVEGRL